MTLILSNLNMNKNLCIFATDSRGNNFNLFENCDLNIKYVIQRGGTIGFLSEKTLTEIKLIDCSKYINIFVKIAAGINDILIKEHHQISVSASPVSSIIDKLKFSFKNSKSYSLRSCRICHNTNHQHHST